MQDLYVANPSRHQSEVSGAETPKATAGKGPPGQSWASSIGVRRSMQSNRGHDTRLEVSLRRALHKMGLRYWTHRRPIPGLRCEADIVFPRLKLAVFVNGCFWHGCP